MNYADSVYELSKERNESNWSGFSNDWYEKIVQTNIIKLILKIWLIVAYVNIFYSVYQLFCFYILKSVFEFENTVWWRQSEDSITICMKWKLQY